MNVIQHLMGKVCLFTCVIYQPFFTLSRTTVIWSWVCHCFIPGKYGGGLRRE